MRSRRREGDFRRCGGGELDAFLPPPMDMQQTFSYVSLRSTSEKR